MSPLESTLDLENLRSRLRYDPETGLFYRKKIWNRVIDPETLTGKLCKDGYVRIKIGNDTFSASRIAWFLHYGEFPTKQLDHINRIRSDNRIANLREVTQRENSANRGRRPDLVGTTFVAAYNKWQAQAKINDRYTYLGLFDTQDEARAAYLIATDQTTLLQSREATHG